MHSTRAWTIFAAASVIWGIPYLFIKVAVDGGVPPAFLAWVRVVLGAVLLLGICWRIGLLGTVRGRLRWIALFALFELVGPFPLIAAGEQRVDSSLAAIIIASAPLFVALLALRFDASERVGGRRLVGLFVGLAGVAALVGVDVAGESDELLGAAALVTAALGYAAGPMVLKRHLSDLDPRVTMAMALTVASVVLTPAALVGPPDEVPPGDALAALAVLGVVCTALGLVVYGMLVAEVGPGRAVVITYVNPVVALGLGIVVLDERPGVGALLGLALILVGSWLSTGDDEREPAPGARGAPGVPGAPTADPDPPIAIER
jgi:drug/metabolite transporter (DMT)-like permease